VPSDFDFLEEAKTLGLLGPAPLDLHRRHSLGFADALLKAWGSRTGSQDQQLAISAAGKGKDLRILDLGSGAGLPGLILAEHWPESSIGLLEVSDRRCRLLEQWVSAAELSSRVEVLCGRAEELGRLDSLRGAFDAVVARLFGRPAVTAECAAPFLRLEGLLVVSDPPARQDEAPLHPEEQTLGSLGSRWPTAELALLGLELAHQITEPFHFTVLRQSQICPDRYPRRTGIPAKRPLF
jgi:16S rRNA (guanine527-N7)-methyltransferase